MKVTETIRYFLNPFWSKENNKGFNQKLTRQGKAFHRDDIFLPESIHKKIHLICDSKEELRKCYKEIEEILVSE